MRKRKLQSVYQSGFTLIELLVVIAILGALMAMGAAGGGAIREQARSAQARNDTVAMVTAIKAFYSDYSRYPIPTSKTDDTPFDPGPKAEGNREVMDILRGRDTAMNPRETVYYEGKAAKESSGVPPKGGVSKDGGFFDPWGSTYGIVVDADYDGRLEYKGTQLRDLTDEEKTISGGAGVFSLGNPKKKGTINSPVSILSWR
ncbi:MAG: hypothetical protein RLZZ399_892 [Verrucomicrobiota bacterium]|jgi:prepilin-type N-terminal cleavage/methylation domain-containing protein